MTISSSVRKAGPFAGNDVTTEFPFTFKVFTTADVLVVRADSLGAEYTLVLTTDYTVSLNANQNTNPGGTVTKNTALATGDSLVISSKVGNLQPVDLTNGGGFYPEVINSALDRATIQIQQLDEKVDRSIKVTITSDLTPDEFVTQLQQGASEASASASAAAASAALAATFVPANYAELAGADFTGPVSTADLLTADGGVALPVDATGNNARRANQTIWNVGGAARLPTWTTAGRPATPTQGDAGENTDLDCIEHYDGAEWVQLQRQESAVVATTSGTSHEITGIPAYATEVKLHCLQVSVSGTATWTIHAGTSAGLAVSGWTLANSIDTSGGTLTTSTAGVPVRVVNAINSFSGVLIFSKQPGTNTWLINGPLVRINGEDIRLSGAITLPGVLDRVGIMRGGADTFDLGSIWATWN